jgi:hypothetical protein
MNILDAYITSKPTPQNAIDIFQGEWSSMLPPNTELKAGSAALFEDQRIVWAKEQAGGFEGLKVIELGPLEAGHTYMLENAGIKSILAIEANTRAYLKCLIIKEVFSLNRTKFLLGDFVEYLRGSDERYGFCLASGVLYHMLNPVELIQLISKVSDTVLLWTHYYDEKVVRADPKLAIKFTDVVNSEHGGFKHTLHKYSYLDALNWPGFCGGAAPYSFWMPKEGILTCLRHFGFRNLRIGFDTLEHPNGPSFCVFGAK